MKTSNQINDIKNEVIVVEGNHDAQHIKRIFPQADIVITNGAEIPPETLDLLKALNDKRGLILLLDPDYPGERIRKIITQHVGPTKHVFIQKHHCINKQGTKVGIEHAPLLIIKKALEREMHEPNDQHGTLTMVDLAQLGLNGVKNASKQREKVCHHFHLGHCNAKTLLKRLNMFAIKKKDLEKVIV